jgi:predicted TIM-barrel fold metal-dependent hydrolase
VHVPHARYSFHSRVGRAAAHVGRPALGAVAGVQARIPEKYERRLTDFTEYRLPQMDDAGIDIQVLSLTVPGMQVDVDAERARDNARFANDYLAKIIGEHPDRFRGFAALPLQDPAAAAAELERAVTQHGLCGALVNDCITGPGGRYRTTQTTTALERMPSSYLGTNIVFTNSGVFSPAVMLGAVLEVGADAVMFSVDYPYESSYDAVQGFERTTLSAADREKIAHGFAERLLRIS